MNQLLIFNPNNSMEKRKPRTEELSLAKSAAWAWLEYRSGSGSDDRSTPEFDVSRSKFNPKASRYKVEAMKRSSSNSSRKIDGSLFDKYEVERISRQLDLCMKPNHRGGRRVVEEDVKRKPAQKKKMSKGFSLLGLINEAAAGKWPCGGGGCRLPAVAGYPCIIQHMNKVINFLLSVSQAML